MYFRGRTSRTIDPKGRLVLPPDYRESLLVREKAMNSSSSELDPGSDAEEQVAQFVITTFDNCLLAYPWPDWIELEKKFTRISNPSPKVRTFRRLFLGGAEVHSLDAQGRIRLSQDHRDYAKLEKEVTLVGLIERFELWNPAMLKSSMEQQPISDVSDELAASGIDFQL